MADFKDLLLKIANNARLTPGELAELARFGTETQLRNSFIAGNTTAENKLNVSLNFQLIFEEKFNADKASVFIDNVPSVFSNIMIVGSGSVTTATGGNLYAQLNGDTGNNYLWLYLQGTGIAAASAKTLATSQLILGQFSNTGDPTGSSSPFQANLFHANGNLHKTVISTSEYDDGTTYSIYLIGGKWKNTTPINSILLYGTDSTGVKGTASIKAGSVISVYGY